MKINFRKLKASEIDARVATVSEKGCSLLLYKDARVDQNILDETVGCTNWKRSHQLIGDRLYCTVEIWDEDKSQWIAKQDVGTESYTEKEKGQASDSFKRACFNLGIGRELYTAPFIWIPASKCKIENKNGRLTTYDRFSVSEIGYDNDGNINSLTIKKDNQVVYKMGEKVVEKSVEPPKKSTDEKIMPVHVVALKNRYGKPDVEKNVFEHFGISSWEEMTMSQMNELIARKGSD